MIERFSGCIHDPKIIIKSFSSALNKLVYYTLCKECNKIPVFNEFVKDTIIINSKNRKFLQYVTIDVRVYFWQCNLNIK